LFVVSVSAGTSAIEVSQPLTTADDWGAGLLADPCHVFIGQLVGYGDDGHDRLFVAELSHGGAPR
jgi:hypothetical protein